MPRPWRRFGALVSVTRRKNTRTGVVSHGNQRPGAQQAVDAEPAAALSGDDHSRGGKGWPQRHEARERAVHGEQQSAGEHGGNTCPAEDDAEDTARPEVGQHQRQEGTERKLPQPRAGVEVGELLVAGRLFNRIGQGDHKNQRENRCEHRTVADSPAAGEPPPQQRLERCHRGEHQRPQDEHLPLDGQRPEVLQGAGPRMVLRVVIHGRLRQLPVLPVEQRRPRLGQNVGPPALRDEGPRGGQDRQEDHDDGGQQPLENVQPVPQQFERFAVFELPREGERQQEGRDQQEDIHSPGNPAEPDVVGRHHEHCQGPQALHLGTETACGLHRAHPVAANHLSANMSPMLVT